MALAAGRRRVLSLDASEGLAHGVESGGIGGADLASDNRERVCGVSQIGAVSRPGARRRPADDEWGDQRFSHHLHPANPSSARDAPTARVRGRGRAHPTVRSVDIEVTDGPAARPGLRLLGYGLGDVDVTDLSPIDSRPADEVLPLRLAPGDRARLTLWFEVADCDMLRHPAR